MKSTRAVVMILLSLLAGIAAVILFARWAGEQSSKNMTPVVVAVRDLDLGEPLTAAMMQGIAWPSGAVPVSSFSDSKKLEGRVIRSPVYKGEPILEPKLAPEGTKGGLPSIIQSGKRAITVKVNEVVGVAGFALPGSFVDIMVNTTDAKDKVVSRIVLKRILVLAVAQAANRDDTKPKVVSAVTLEVTPEEAEKIDLARSIGTLSLVLRNSIDLKETESAGAHRDDLLGKVAAPPAVPVAAPAAAPPRRVSQARPAVAPPPKAAVTVEVIRGMQNSISEF